MFLARRNLFQDKTRLALSIGGVALAMMLILLLNGLLTGLNRQLTSYLSNSPGSIVIAQKGVRNLLGATSLLPPGIIENAETVDGVEKVVPILSQFVILDLHNKKQPAYLIGYDPERGGGPWQMATGREPQTDSEVVLDEVLAKRHDMHIGDSFKVMGKDFTIVGFSRGTSSWMTSFFFVRKAAAENLLRVLQATSFLLVTPASGQTLEDVRQQLNAISGVDALTKTEMAANDIKLFVSVFSTPLKLMVTIAFLVGTMIVGLVIYTATVERQREYGVLKAIGASNRTMYAVVVTQALIATSLGFLIGVPLAYGIGRWIMFALPQFLVILDPRDVALALLAGLVMAIIAALFPARVVAGLAPAEVFRK